MFVPSAPLAVLGVGAVVRAVAVLRSQVIVPRPTSHFRAQDWVPAQDLRITPLFQSTIRASPIKGESEMEGRCRPRGGGGASPTTGPEIPAGPGGGTGKTWMPQASSADVSHPITYSYKNTPGAEAETITITPPSGYYTVIQDPASLSNITSGTIVNPIQSSYLSFKVWFYPIQEEPVRYLGDSAGLEVTRPQGRANGATGSMMFPDVDFAAELGSDARTGAGAKPGRNYGRIIGTNLLSGVGGHRFRFKTAHSPVSTPAAPTTDVVEATGTDTYQIKTPESFMHVKQLAVSGGKRITIKFYDATQVPGAVVSGLYTVPSGAPKGPSYRFEQLAATNGTFSLKYTSYQPGQDPDGSMPIAFETKTVTWQTVDHPTQSERLKFIYEPGPETEVAENMLYPGRTSIDGVTYPDPLRIEAFRKVLGTPASSQVLETERRIYQLRPNRQDLVRHERGSVSGAGLSTNWTANECLTWTRSDYDTSGRVVLTLGSNGQWRRFDNANLPDGGLKITEMLPTASLPNNGFASTLSQFLSSGRVNVSATTLVAWSGR